MAMPEFDFQRDEDSDSRWWCLIDGERFCYIIGGNKRYMAERGTQTFGPGNTKQKAAELAWQLWQ